jgi:hypothetical protein
MNEEIVQIPPEYVAKAAADSFELSVQVGCTFIVPWRQGRMSGL